MYGLFDTSKLYTTKCLLCLRKKKGWELEDKSINYLTIR